VGGGGGGGFGGGGGGGGGVNGKVPHKWNLVKISKNANKQGDKNMKCKIQAIGSRKMGDCCLGVGKMISTLCLAGEK